MDEEGEDVEYLLLVGRKIIPNPGMGQVKQQPLGIKKTQGCSRNSWGFTQLGK